MKLIIFDFDGVIFDSGEIGYLNLLKQFPYVTREIAKELMTGNYHENLTKFKKEHNHKDLEGNELLAHQQAYLQKKLLAPMYDGVKELLSELHSKGYRLVLNTSSWERNLLPLMEKQGISHLFDYIASADVSRNKTEKFKMIEEKYGVKNSETLFVTDTLGDLREADLAGVPTVCVTWGAHDHTFFNRELHKNLVKIVDTMDELKELILSR